MRARCSPLAGRWETTTKKTLGKILLRNWFLADSPSHADPGMGQTQAQFPFIVILPKSIGKEGEGRQGKGELRDTASYRSVRGMGRAEGAKCVEGSL